MSGVILKNQQHFATLKQAVTVASTARAFDRYEVNADKANPRDG